MRSKASTVNRICDMVLRKYVSFVFVKNLIDFHKTVETGVDMRLVALTCQIVEERYLIIWLADFAPYDWSISSPYVAVRTSSS